MNDLFLPMMPSIAVMICGAGALLGGLFVITHDVRRPSSKAFFALATAVGLWSFALGIALYPQEVFSLSGLSPLLNIAGAMIPPALFMFSVTLASEHALMTRFSIGAVYLPMIIAIAASITPGVLSISAGRIPAIVGYATIYIFAALVILMQKYRTSAGVFRQSLRRMLIAVLVTITIPLVFFAVFRHDIRAVLMATAATSGVMVGTMGAVLVAYHVLNVRLYAVELFTSSALLLLITETLLVEDSFNRALSLFTTVLVALVGIALARTIEHDARTQRELGRLHHKLSEAHRTLAELDAEKSTLVSIASHHLRDPLTAIKGYSSMLLEGSFGELSLSLREAIGRVFQSSERLVKIIDDFLNVARIESGEMPYASESFDLRAMVGELVQDLSALASRAGLTLTLAIDPHHPHITVHGDAGKLRQVISNLIDNAIRYNVSGGSIAVSLALVSRKGGEVAHLSVTDTGIGLAESDLERIFEKFGRAQGVSKVYTEGSGLGLYLAREILARHHGRIWAESAGPGKGAVFHLEVPSFSGKM